MSRTAAAARLGSGAMFDRIAARYDLLNRLISLGLDRPWRRRMVQELGLPESARVLDLASGTGDVALEVLRQHRSAEVVAFDPSPRMLQIAARKLDAAGWIDRYQIQIGTAESLPYPDRSFDGITMAFGIRNVEDRGCALREIQRVLKPRGSVAILEGSEPSGNWSAPLCRFWMHRVVPRLGAWISSAPEYRYLPASISEFPSAEQFSSMLRQSGLGAVRVIPMQFGVATLFLATRLELGA